MLQTPPARRRPYEAPRIVASITLTKLLKNAALVVCLCAAVLALRLLDAIEQHTEPT